MTDNEIIRALENYSFKTNALFEAIKLIKSQKAEIERLQAFKHYFDELYGKGLEVANWHLNGNTEPFDNFYESALEEMEEV